MVREIENRNFTARGHNVSSLILSAGSCFGKHYTETWPLRPLVEEKEEKNFWCGRKIGGLVTASFGVLGL